MVGSNHHRKPYPGEDLQMFEKGLPGNDPWGDGSVSTLPLETCETMNGSWGYNKDDQDFKSVGDLIHYLARAASNNANFLLNVGPKPDGTIQSEFVETLAEMGKWLKKNGEAVYGTRGGPIAEQSWGVTTQKDNTIYLHVFTDTDKVIAAADLGGKIQSAKLLSGEKVAFEQTKVGTIFSLPDTGRDEYDTVIAVQLQK